MKHLIIILLLLPFGLMAQQDSLSQQDKGTRLQLGRKVAGKQHLVYLDGGIFFFPWQDFFVPTPGLVSINYEWQLFQAPRARFSASLRGGAANWDGLLGIPLGCVALLGRNQHHLEGSLGAFIGIVEATGSLFSESRPHSIYGLNIFAWPLCELGYRYQRPEGGLMFRFKVGTVGIGSGVGWVF
ncbi:MAG: hypothetical protein AAF927_17405 [Bacteroidota bacterium]